MVARPILHPLPDRIRSERLEIGCYRPGDGTALFRAVQESLESLAPWMPWAACHQTAEDSEEAVRRWMARWIERTDLTMGIWRREDGLYLGGTGLHRMDWQAGIFEISYWIRTSAERQGYVTEAVRRLAAFAFEELDAQVLRIRCAPGHARSVAVAERCGFKPAASDPGAACPGSSEPSLVFESRRAEDGE